MGEEKSISQAAPARLHVIVSGRVQGVGFRAYVTQSASYLGLRGWVRNVGYDQVETMAEGPRATLEKFLEIVRTGPRMSHVEDTKVEWWDASGEFTHFIVNSSR
ncbi:MAG: acylphosphatase [Anaerolineales bacterium]|nr:acylphosphatase [Anaerolineales bacterium]